MRVLALALCLVFALTAHAGDRATRNLYQFNAADFDVVSFTVSLDLQLRALAAPTGIIPVDTPQLTATAGIGEALALIGDSDTMALGQGVYAVTLTCTQFTTSDFADANGTAGGGAFILNGLKGVTIEGRGMGATIIDLTMAYTVAGCGLGAQTAAVFSAFRIGSGASSSANVTENITFRNLTVRSIQSDLDEPAANLVPSACFHVTDRGTVRGLEFDHVECIQKQDEIGGGTPHAGYGWFIDAPASGVIAEHETIKLVDSRCKTSGRCLYNKATQYLEYSGNDFQSVIETGYACSDELTYKLDGNQQGSRNRFGFLGDCATHCGMAAPGEYALRFQHWDGRGSRDYAGRSASETHGIFRTTPTCAKRMFEMEYITGYNALTLASNKFVCSVDDIDSETAGDTVRDVCETIVIQIDKRDNGPDTNCPVGQSCNIGGLITDNIFDGFRDTCTTGCVAFTDSCPIQIQEPEGTQLGDNWFWLIPNNVFHLPAADGDPDTGVHADGFCGTTIDFLTNNFIGSNVVVGQQKWCLAGQGINGCPHEYDIANRWVTSVPASYLVSTLPSADTADPDDGNGRTVIVTDGNSATDCTVGGGANINWCRDNGAAWGNP